MTDANLSTYEHTQRGPWFLLLCAFAAALFAASWFAPLWALKITFLATGLLMFLFAVSFWHLAVTDQHDRLVVRQRRRGI